MDNTLKELTIGEASYRIVKMPAQTGSWLLMLLMGKLTEIMSEQSDKAQTSSPEAAETNPADAASAAISFMLMKLDKDTFAQVQREALGSCQKLVNGVPMPVVMKDGRFAAAELEYDIAATMQLTSQSIHLNLAPFFVKGKLMEMVTAG